jgi:hypothetical protein
MPGVFPDYPAPVIRNTDTGTEIAMMRWGRHRRRLGSGLPKSGSRLRSEPKHAAEAPGLGFLHCLGTELGIAVRPGLEFVVSTMN